MSDSDEVTRHAPLWPSALAVLTGLSASLLIFWSLDSSDPASFRVATIGYLLGGVVTPLAVGLHRYLRDRVRRRTPYFVPRYRYDRAAAAAVTVGILAAVWHAFVVATELAR